MSLAGFLPIRPNSYSCRNKRKGLGFGERAAPPTLACPKHTSSGLRTQTFWSLFDLPCLQIDRGWRSQLLPHTKLPRIYRVQEVRSNVDPLHQVESDPAHPFLLEHSWTSTFDKEVSTETGGLASSPVLQAGRYHPALQPLYTGTRNKLDSCISFYSVEVITHVKCLFKLGRLKRTSCRIALGLDLLLIHSLD
jgi:hypothetical protein